MSSYDIIIIGAGLSGINSAYRLEETLPDHSFIVLEARDSVGGTWSFWRYPGARCDSSMAVFGFPWRPWPYDSNMVDAQKIRDYIDESASLHGLDKLVRLGHRVTSASWSAEEQRWTLTVRVSSPGGPSTQEFKSKWIINCSGYYDYDKPREASIPGLDRFKGQVVHPQFWKDETDYAKEKIVIIGSGATAVTLFPVLAKTAASVTILQRSPSYVMSMPSKNSFIRFLQLFLPVWLAATLNWWYNMIEETLFVAVSTAYPRLGRKIVKSEMVKQLPPGFDIDKHFTPRYNLFDQRLCFCPDNDFFQALHQPHCNIVTDTIETVTETGIRTTSGLELEADMIVTATGLYMNLMSSIPLTVDGEPVVLGRVYAWNGMMLEGVPNAGTVVGYTTSTWTPGADVRMRSLIKVIKHTERLGATSAVPYIDPEERKRLPRKPVLTNSSTYIVDAIKRLPMVADVGPWRYGRSWFEDMRVLLFGDLVKGLRFTAAGKSKAA
ncbi:hypothetical protein VTK73DRAFT_8053 [Phialemonium thermophilum]|uniref:Monooxygenase n=1 Tax=Phialemonium thermophilum TaxID=223376 RepID=A0ABR3XR96_9PEZI